MFDKKVTINAKTWVSTSARLSVEALGKPEKLTNRVSAHVGILKHQGKCVRGRIGPHCTPRDTVMTYP